jgi:polysaccharide deacetylase 2 family uncharacterized protein YibQ
LAPKKRSQKKKTGRKRSARRPSFGLNLLKVLVGLTALVLLIAAAGLLTHHYIKPKAPVITLLPSTDVKKPPALPETATRPYEVFPKIDLPPAIPLPKPIPQVEALPKVAIIIDDLGYDRRMAKNFLSLDNRLTFAVLPQAPHTRSIAKTIIKKGGELMLHLPMEPTEYPTIDPGPGALLSSMSPDELLAQLRKNLSEMPGIKGVNNHMGSNLTADSTRLYQVFSVLKEEGLFFIDSRSTAETVGRPSARLFQLPFAERDVFIDHDQDPDIMRGQIRKLVRIARKNGEAVGIAHPTKATFQILKEMLPEMKKEVQLVPASEIVHVLS